MKRVFLTGMSGTGKSAVISELVARGYKAIDTDEPLLRRVADVEIDTSAPLDEVGGRRRDRDQGA